MKHEKNESIKNPGMSTFLSRQDAQKKVKAVINRHLVAASEELAVELANSIDPESEFGKSLKRFIHFKNISSGSKERTKVSVSSYILSDCKATLPETYIGCLSSTAHLENQMTCRFPFDIHFKLRPFNFKKRAVDDLFVWNRMLFFPTWNIYS